MNNITPEDFRREDIPVEVIGRAREVFPNLAAANVAYPDLDLFHNGQRFTWAMYGCDPVTRQTMARFETWETNDILSR